MYPWSRPQVFALLAALSACSKEVPAPPTQPPPAAVSAAAVDGPASLEDGLRGVAEIEALRPALRKVEGRLEGGDTGGAFEAYFEGGVLRCVEEQAASGSKGQGARAYYLDSTGVLFYHHAEHEAVAARGSGSGADSVSIRIAFDPAGNVRASEKTLNGQPAPLLEADVRGALSRLGALRQAADAAGRAGQGPAGRAHDR